MGSLPSLWWILIPGVPLALYGLHRGCLRLEERGLLYYTRRSPRGGTGGGLTALQQIVEPGTQHVFQIKEEKRGESEEGVPGADEWSPGRSPFGGGQPRRE